MNGFSVVDYCIVLQEQLTSFSVLRAHELCNQAGLDLTGVSESLSPDHSLIWWTVQWELPHTDVAASKHVNTEVVRYNLQDIPSNFMSGIEINAEINNSIQRLHYENPSLQNFDHTYMCFSNLVK